MSHIFTLPNISPFPCYKLQAQLVVLASQIAWSESLDAALNQIEQKGGSDLGPLETVLQIVVSTLNVLADSVLHEQPPVRRKKLEHLVRFLKYLCINTDPPFSMNQHKVTCILLTI